MTLVHTESLKPDSLHGLDNLQVYCGLDTCVTLECFEEITREHQPPPIYSFERALQAPYLAMMRRGFLVDQLSRREAAAALHVRMDFLSAWINQMAQEVWDRPLNPQSPKQKIEFFYQAMRIPEIFSYKKGQKKVSTDRVAMEKISNENLYARPIAEALMRFVDLKKQSEFLEKPLDNDGRFRPGYNIAGTQTGRSSSSENSFGTGDNAQNIPEPLRYPLVADPGMRMAVLDLEQSEARDVGYLCGALFGKWKFLNNCESGDLHTSNARLVYPDLLPWTGNLKEDRKLAEQPFYRDYTYRYMAKRLGHLTDYMGTSFTSARILKIPVKEAEDFRQRYVTGPEAAYPEIAEYWAWIAQQIQTSYRLVTPFGRERHFFARPNDDSTLREAIAHIPQSMTADRMSLGMWRVWKYMPQVQLLANGYDSITFQYEDRGSDYENQIIDRAKELCDVPLVARGRTFRVPVEAKVGWNWGSEVTVADVEKAKSRGQKVPRLNLDGLRKHDPQKPDSRTRAVWLRRIMQ